MGEQIVRCNWCMKTFDESEILYNPIDNVEACPYCHRSGYLMDLSEDDYSYDEAKNGFSDGRYNNVLAKLTARPAKEV